MNEDISALLSNIKRTAPVSDTSLAKLHTQLGTTLPPSYEDFFRFSNGIEGFINKDFYLALWPVEKLVTNNQGYSVDEFAPGLFLIGSDGGDEAYGLDLRPGSATYGYFVNVPFIGMDWQESRLLGATFTDF